MFRRRNLSFSSSLPNIFDLIARIKSAFTHYVTHYTMFYVNLRYTKFSCRSMQIVK